MTDLLKGRRGVVVGVSGESSIGFAAAQTFREHGARVAVTCRPERQELVAELARRHGLVGALPLEVTDEDSVRSAFESIGEALGELDFIVHTLVSVEPDVLVGSVLDISSAQFFRTLDVSAHSLLRITKAALPLLEASRSPRIVTLLSAGADFTIPNYHLVGIAKATLAATLRYLAQELGPAGVLCNGVSFSILQTDAANRVIGSELTSKSHGYVTKHSLTKAPLQAEHVTNAIAFLVSELCQNTTGEILNIDGGYSKNYF